MTPNYIRNLLQPNGQKSAGKRIWSIDLETVWLPFFTATNTDGLTVIPNDVLGAPLRLGYEKDGSVRFNARTGKPVIRVAKDLSDEIRLVRENFVAGLQNFVAGVQSKQAEGYTAQAKLNIEAGQPIRDKDHEALQLAMAEQMEQAIAEQQLQPVAEPVADPVAVTA